jgi:hypothetical protein
MPEIAHRVYEQHRANLVACALRDLFRPAERDHCLASGLAWTHSRAAILCGLLIEMKTNLFVQTALE